MLRDTLLPVPQPPITSFEISAELEKKVRDYVSGFGAGKQARLRKRKEIIIKNRGEDYAIAHHIGYCDGTKYQYESNIASDIKNCATGYDTGRCAAQKGRAYTTPEEQLQQGLPMFYVVAYQLGYMDVLNKRMERETPIGTPLKRPCPEEILPAQPLPKKIRLISTIPSFSSHDPRLFSFLRTSAEMQKLCEDESKTDT